MMNETKKMSEMWPALEKYQPFADKHGFGAAWLKMTTDRTAPATRLAWLTTTSGAFGASDATGWATASSSMAVSAVVAATAMRFDRPMIGMASAAAIKYINRAIALEETK